MDYYFEFPNNVVGTAIFYALGWRTIPHKYCVRLGTPGFEPLMPDRLSYYAQRIWAEDHQGKITYVKNRLEPNPQVDLKEFMWVKLSAHQV